MAKQIWTLSVGLNVGKSPSPFQLDKTIAIFAGKINRIDMATGNWIDDNGAVITEEFVQMEIDGASFEETQTAALALDQDAIGIHFGPMKSTHGKDVEWLTMYQDDRGLETQTYMAPIL